MSRGNWISAIMHAVGSVAALGGAYLLGGTGGWLLCFGLIWLAIPSLTSFATR